MHSTTVLFFITAFFAVSATANPVNANGSPTTGSQCNTGAISCCNSLQSADSSAVTSLLGPLGIVLTGVTGLVGLGCTPIIGVVTGSNCAQQPVCCTGNNFNGLVNVGCTPISL